MRKGRGRAGLLLWALGAGVLLWLPSPGAPRPLGGLLALVALVPLLLLVRPDNGLSPRAAWGGAFLAGVVYYGFSDSWLVHHFAGIYPVKTLGSAAVMLAGLLLVRRLARRISLPLAAGMGWASGEWIRSRLPELPYPHHQVAHSLYDHLWFAGSASFTGEVGLNFLAAFTAGAWALLWVSRREGSPERKKASTWAVLALALLGGNALLSRYALSRLRTRPGPEVGLVQGMLSLFGKDMAGTGASEFAVQLGLTRKACAAGPLDLLVWSETSFPVSLVEGGGRDRVPTILGTWMDPRRTRQVVRSLSARILESADLRPGGGFVAGALAFCPDRRDPAVLVPENRAYLWDARGRIAGWVSKRNLVPGGEFLPFLRWLPFGLGLKAERFFLKLGVPTLQAGEGPLTMELPGTGRFGAAICYDNAFPDHFARATREGALWHLVLSNEAWYENGAELDQMLAMTVFRALECNRSVVRCTNSGITCLVDPGGRIGPVLRKKGRDRGFRGILRVRVPLCSVTTWTATVSGWPGLGLLIFAFLLAFFPLAWPGGFSGGRMARIPEEREVSS